MMPKALQTVLPLTCSNVFMTQLKILQEVITRLVFVPFAMLYMRQRVHLDFLWAGGCRLGAVYFVCRAKGG